MFLAIEAVAETAALSVERSGGIAGVVLVFIEARRSIAERDGCGVPNGGSRSHVRGTEVNHGVKVSARKCS